MCGAIQPAMPTDHCTMSMPSLPAPSSARSRARQGSTGNSVKSILMPVAFSNAGATSSTMVQCQGPLSPT